MARSADAMAISSCCSSVNQRVAYRSRRVEKERTGQPAPPACRKDGHHQRCCPRPSHVVLFIHSFYILIVIILFIIISSLLLLFIINLLLLYDV